MKPIEVDVWVRGTLHATTHTLPGVTPQAEDWTDLDVQRLLGDMLLAIEREKNPDGDPPPVTLRGFSWIVSPYDGGVVVHLEMAMGTASAGPFQIDQERLTGMIERAMRPASASSRVH